MAFKSQQVSAPSTAATALNGADADQVFGQSLTFWSSVPLAIGGSDVTWAAGAQWPANIAFSVDLDPTELLYVIPASGTATVHVVHRGV